MSRLGFFFHKVISKFSRDSNEYMINYYRKQGIEIGDSTHIFSEIITSEPYLLHIGKNSTISTNVSFLTHDASIGALIGRENASDLCGDIYIGNNSFIGNNAIILLGVTLADNTIVAAGSVVTKSFLTPGVIVAGNPAKVVGSTDSYIVKNQSYFLSLHGNNSEERKKKILENPLRRVKR